MKKIVNVCPWHLKHIWLAGIFVLSSQVPLSLVSKAELTPPSNSGTPRGNRVPGTTRPESTCLSTDHELTALFENQGSYLTGSLQPTFWFYVPYASEQIKSVQFILWDRDERDVLFSASVASPEEPGFLGITLPDSVQLEDDTFHHWYFSVSCAGSQSNEPDKTVDGWVKYQPDISLPYEEYDSFPSLVETGFWYDAINLAFLNYYQNPDVYLDNLRFVLNHVGAGELPTSIVYLPVMLDEN